jgi:hypothetical protein
LNAITTIIEILAVRIKKPWLYIEWIFNVTKVGTQYYNSVKHGHDTINNEILRKKITREAADKRDLHHEKTSLMDILLQHGEINNEDTVAVLPTIASAGTGTTSKSLLLRAGLACGEPAHPGKGNARTRGYLQ